MIFSPTWIKSVNRLYLRRERTDINDLDVGPGLVTDCLIILFVIMNTNIIVFDGLIRVPAFILGMKDRQWSLAGKRIWTYIRRGDLDTPNIPFDNLSIITERF
jgi:hypothetical protein